MPAPASQFSLVCCQQGAESAIKDELAPDWRLAFSRPGFVTLKYAAEDRPDEGLDLPKGVFVRTSAWSIGRASGNQSEEVVSDLLKVLHGHCDAGPFDLLHLWSRDRLPVGERGFQPGDEPLTESIAEFLSGQLSKEGLVRSPMANQVARSGDRVLDVIMVDPGSWWVGWHEAQSPETKWPGGTFPIDRNREVVSRAFFKTAEAIAWSGFPMQPGDCVIEIGSAPGGSAQRLLELGMHVKGIDPADMDEQILEHPGFQHVRARGGDVKRSLYADGRWLLVDSNVKPEKTLTTVENVVTNRQTSFQGMLLTLKLSSYERCSDIAGWIRQIQSWGFANTRVRQLATGKKEVCVVASPR